MDHHWRVFSTFLVPAEPGLGGSIRWVRLTRKAERKTRHWACLDFLFVDLVPADLMNDSAWITAYRHGVLRWQATGRLYKAVRLELTSILIVGPTELSCFCSTRFLGCRDWGGNLSELRFRSVLTSVRYQKYIY